VTLKHDDLAKQFLDRMARDKCAPKLTYVTGADGKSIASVTLTTAKNLNNVCSVPIPITFPDDATADAGTGTVVRDKLGSEPLILWVTMNGAPRTFQLSKPVAI
jgi:hypothetical protein